MLTTQEQLSNFICCEVDLVSDLMDEFNCMSMLASRCKAPDHYVLTTTFQYYLSGLKVNNDVHSDVNHSEYDRNYRTVDVQMRDKRYTFDSKPVTFMNYDEWRIWVTDMKDNIDVYTQQTEVSQDGLDLLYEQFVSGVCKEMEDNLVRVKTNVHVNNENRRNTK